MSLFISANSPLESVTFDTVEVIVVSFLFTAVLNFLVAWQQIRVSERINPSNEFISLVIILSLSICVLYVQSLHLRGGCPLIPAPTETALSPPEQLPFALYDHHCV